MLSILQQITASLINQLGVLCWCENCNPPVSLYFYSFTFMCITQVTIAYAGLSKVKSCIKSFKV